MVTKISMASSFLGRKQQPKTKKTVKKESPENIMEILDS